MLYTLESPYYNIYENLALEEYLFQNNIDGIVLMLWQNRDCVVIGKHQYAWQECRIPWMEQNGVLLARRSTGGGAVFHDMHNLNYSFICQEELYDASRQIAIVISALQSLGIKVQKSGRNDLVTEDGYKISGTAFRQRGSSCLHHGTLMVDVDIDKLEKSLSPSKEKLQAKGIKSIRSRVNNLKDYNANITVEQIKKSLKAALEDAYGEKSKELLLPPKEEYEKILKRQKDRDWNYGVRK